MTASRLTIDERQVGDVTVLVLSGEMVVDDGDVEFRKRVDDLIDRGSVKIVLDLGGLSHIDSSGVGMFIAKLKMLKKKGGDLRLLRVSRRVENLLAMLKLLMLFQRFDDEDAAVRSFARPA